MIGRSAARPEDARLLRGEGRYSADRLPAGTLHAAFVRSPHAHAAIRGIDAAAALALPGVQGLTVGRTLLYPQDGDVAGAVAAAASLLKHTASAHTAEVSE